MPKLLTRKDLAERWQVTERTIDEYRITGVIVPIKNIPSIRFNEEYIKEIEGYIPEKVTRREKLLEKEILKITDKLQSMTEERDLLRVTLSRILLDINKGLSISKREVKSEQANS